MIRRLLKDRDNAVASLVVAGVLTALIFGYGEVQQRDETIIAQDGRPTAYAAKE
ncbi:hypothetical protein [Achromobacter pulmonis]|uniref:hypothetical protein n=1 Tax=Achromobacter pulmonis TaxID=1389932 RepID=UPI0015E84D30|nr:hypothetical protein [Achromobacter pulmonis]